MGEQGAEERGKDSSLLIGLAGVAKAALLHSAASGSLAREGGQNSEARELGWPVGENTLSGTGSPIL